MTLHFYKDEALTDPLSEGDFSNPDQDAFNGTDGESKDRRLFVANAHALLAEAMTTGQTTMALEQPAFASTEILVVGTEQMRVLSGGGTAALNVERGYGGTQPTSHDIGDLVYSGYNYGQMLVEVLDTNGSDESAWLQLATTPEGLDNATPGAPLALGSKSHNQTLSFWRRVTVPPGTPVQNKTDFQLRLTALENPIL